MQFIKTIDRETLVVVITFSDMRVISNNTHYILCCTLTINHFLHVL